jgi:hypothetical protein
MWNKTRIDLTGVSTAIVWSRVSSAQLLLNVALTTSRSIGTRALTTLLTTLSHHKESGRIGDKKGSLQIERFVHAELEEPYVFFQTSFQTQPTPRGKKEVTQENWILDSRR